MPEKLLALIAGLAVGACCWAVVAANDAPPRPAVASMNGDEAGQVRDDNGLAMQFVWCPPGFVAMEQVERELDGTPKPDVEMTLVNALVSRGYWLGKYEVTQAQWRQIMQSDPWKGRENIKEGDDFPATYVCWHEAVAFCRNLTRQERKAGRLPADWEFTLPTEAQWERACRARTETRFSFGNDESQLGEYAWFGRNSAEGGESYAHPVGKKKPNPWGLYDMHGNVWEWCRDEYSEKLPGGRDPFVTDAGLERIMRGGGHLRAPVGCEPGFRNKHTPDWHLHDLGFRVALCPVRPAPESLPP